MGKSRGKRAILIPHEVENIISKELEEQKCSGDIKNKQRFYCKHGKAHFTCCCRNHWTSHHSWCVIDLKKRKICRRYYQECQNCNAKAIPVFSKGVMEKIIKRAVESFLVRSGKKAATERRRVESTKQGNGEHDTDRCEMCRERGKPCNRF